MRVRFRTNLGSRDAAKWGVDFRQCTAGAEVDMDDAAAEWLAKSGIAEVLASKVGRPRKVTTVPPAVDTRPNAPEVTMADSSDKE